MSGQVHAPAALYTRKRPGTHCTGGCNLTCTMLKYIIIAYIVYILTLYMCDGCINIIYSFVITPPWEWRFIADTCRRVQAYVQLIILLCGHVGVCKWKYSPFSYVSKWIRTRALRTAWPVGVKFRIENPIHTAADQSRVLWKSKQWKPHSYLQQTSTSIYNPNNIGDE
jgi:hypothetical protein